MKIKIITLMIGLSITLAPTQATANPLTTLSTWVRTSIFGQSQYSQFSPVAEPSNSKITRLPVEIIQPSIWTRIWQRATNFFNWRFFYNSGQAAQAPASHEQQAQPSFQLSPEASALLVSKLDALRKEKEEKKLAVLAQERNAPFKEIHDSELKSKKEQLARAQQEKQKYEAEHIATMQINDISEKMANFSKTVNERINRMNDRHNNNVQLLTYLTNNLPRDASKQTAARLPVLATDTSASTAPIELLQSIVGATSNPVLNTSITGEIVESFAQLSHTPSPELPTADHLMGSESIYQHIQVDPTFYESKAQKGRTYLQLISQGNFLPQLQLKSQDEHLEVIETILYRLHQNASYKGQGFLEGTYVIQDTENFDLFNTLLSYIKRVNPEVTGTVQDPLAHVSLNPFGYPRDASHYTYNKKKHPFYGIDLRRSDYSTFSLPGDHAHLLIGFVNKDKRLIFIKPEHKGIYILDGWLGHCNEFITAQCRKNNWFGKTVRGLASLFGYEIWTDDNPLYHKERIPADFIKQFGVALAQEEALTVEQKQQLTAKAKQLGIQTLTDDQIAQSEAFQAMKNAYKAKYETLENRSGREVHFNLQQLITLEQ